MYEASKRKPRALYLRRDFMASLVSGISFGVLFSSLFSGISLSFLYYKPGESFLFIIISPNLKEKRGVTADYIM